MYTGINLPVLSQGTLNQNGHQNLKSVYRIDKLLGIKENNKIILPIF